MSKRRGKRETERENQWYPKSKFRRREDEKHTGQKRKEERKENPRRKRRKRERKQNITRNHIVKIFSRLQTSNFHFDSI